MRELKDELGLSKMLIMPNEELSKDTPLAEKEESESESEESVPTTRRSERKSQSKYKFIEDDHGFDIFFENGQGTMYGEYITKRGVFVFYIGEFLVSPKFHKYYFLQQLCLHV